MCSRCLGSAPAKSQAIWRPKNFGRNREKSIRVILAKNRRPAPICLKLTRSLGEALRNTYRVSETLKKNLTKILGKENRFTLPRIEPSAYHQKPHHVVLSAKKLCWWQRVLTRISKHALRPPFLVEGGSKFT